MDTDINQIRLHILNQLRIYNSKFRKEYGQMVICLEGGSWRKDKFPQYKASRKKTRDASTLNWDFVFSNINQVVQEIRDNLPYIVIQSDGAEADDIIGILAKHTSTFGNFEPVMIVSSDKDFMQLQVDKHIKQFSVKHKKLISTSDADRFLKEQILTGDREDGIPNILSPDNCLTDGIRQTPMYQTTIQEALESKSLDQWADLTGWTDNLNRNREMIDLSYTPDHIVEDVISKYEEGPKIASKMKLLNYLIKNKCKNLVENIQEF